MPPFLETLNFRDPVAAREEFARLGTGLPEGALVRLNLLLSRAPDPEQTLQRLGRFRAAAPGAFERAVSSPATLQYLVATMGYSSFLSEGAMRFPESVLQLAHSGSLYRVLSCEEYKERLAEFLHHPAGVPAAFDMAHFRRLQLLRIVLRDVLGLATLADVTDELSNLADAVLDFCYRRIRDDLVERYGEPLGPDGQPCGFCVIALGKLGGKELNYSSDIDLMFVYSANGETAGPAPITNKEFFKKAANRITELLSTYTAEGLCYRVDLRLRPEGRFGEVAISVGGAETYYRERARDWEKQMLIKARVAAGDAEPGRRLLESVEEVIYSSTLDFKAVEAVSETRQRIGEKVAARRAARSSGLDIKLAPGGIRDIEFLVQCLQRLHGGREPWVRHGGTLFALFRLRDKDLLSGLEYARLAAAYEFFRHLEHRLQFDEDRQVHTLPTDPAELEVLARKMPREGDAEVRTAAWLEKHVEQHLGDVRELYERVIHAQQPMYYTPVEAGAPDLEPAEDLMPNGAVNLTRFLDHCAPQLAAALARTNVRRSRERLDHFLEQAVADPDLLARLNGDAVLVARMVDLFEHSQYFADQLLRHPELLREIQGDAGGGEEPLADATALRRYFRRAMLRIQSESMFGGAPIFTTLDKTSDLADSVIAATYRIAIAEAPPPAGAGYRPRDQMMVIALGRLGMREFDLASDADLVFVIPDEDAGEQLYWTAVAERMINTISVYTGEGIIFSVDTRLRPNGREGGLVQTEGAYKTYFARSAEAWEGIAYMKSRAVAGNVERATEFLHELQKVDWRRYGQSGRSRKELAQMRARLEKEQGGRELLKAGAGGYYDIDFALMYLRLKGAGIFYKVLNTPARIDVIEQMGHLDPEDADFLRDAATFYRSLDHGLRISTGHAGGKLPTAPSQFEVLTDLVHRWIPEHLRHDRLDIKLAEIRRDTRAVFNRLFAA